MNHIHQYSMFIHVSSMSIVFMKFPYAQNRFTAPCQPRGAGRLPPQQHLDGDVNHRTSELLLIFSPPYRKWLNIA